MAYVDTLLASYKNANAGVEADAATKLAIDALATQVTLGKLTEAQALTQTLAFTNDTTAVAIATYQFFTGAAPSEAGLAYLLNNAASANDLNDTTGLYGSFNQESRFINFSINLALGSSSAASFASTYGLPITVEQTVATAYNKIIGNDVAAAAGVDVSAAVAYLSRAENVAAVKAFVIANNPTFTETQVDLAVKAALIGEILNIAVSTGLGGYAEAVNAAVKDLADDGHYKADAAAGVDLFVSYPAGPTPGENKVLTTAIDSITGTAGADTYTGLFTGVAATNTLNPLDTISGGAGEDTLIINATDALTTTNLSGVTLSSIENVSVRSTNAVTLDSSAWTDTTSLKVTQAGGAVALTAADTTNVAVSGATSTIAVDGGKDVSVTTAAGANVTIGAATVSAGDVSVTATKVAGSSIAVDGGKAVTLSVAGSTGAGTITVGNGGAATDLPTGAVSVTSAHTAVAGTDATLDAITVKGGSTISVVQTVDTSKAAADTVGSTVTQGAVTIVGGDATTSVSVTQAKVVAEVLAVASVAGVTETASVKFGALTAGDTLEVGGLTLTAKVNMTAAEVASAFSNLINGKIPTAGDTQGAAAAAKGTFSGAITGWTSGAVSTDTVVFTSTTEGVVGHLTPALTNTSGTSVAPVTTTTNGVDAAGETGVLGVDVGVVTINDNATASITNVSVNGYGGASVIGAADTLSKLATLSLANSKAGSSMTVDAAAVATLGLTVNAVAGTGTTVSLDGAADNALKTLNVTATGANSTFGLTAASVTALNVAGDKVLNLATGSTLSAVETVKVTGSAGLTLGTSVAGTATSIDTTGTTGAVSATISGTQTTYAGGAGADTVTLNSTTISKAISLGGGSDKLVLAAGTTSSSATISGGDGTDTISGTAATLATLSTDGAFAGKIDGFEKVEATGAAAAGVTNTINMANLDGINYAVSAVAGGAGTNQTTTVTVTRGTVEAGDVFKVTINGTDFSYTSLAADTATDIAVGLKNAINAGSTGVSATNAAGVITLTGSSFTAYTASAAVTDNGTADASIAAVAGATAVAAGTTEFSHFAAAGTVELTAASSGLVKVTLDDATGTADVLNLKLTNTASTNFGTVAAAGVETVNITSTDSGTPFTASHTLSLTDTALKSVVVTGNAALVLTHNSNVLTSIDGSAMTAGLTASTGNGGSATITGGAGNDVLTAKATSDILVGGAGDDTLIAQGDLNTLTGGAGNDVFNVTKATLNVNSYATITDFSAGDLIKIDGVTSFTSAKIVLGDTAVFQDFANAAINSLGTGGAAWFQYAGNTYVVADLGSNGTSFDNGTDVIVKLTGAVDLSTASLNTTHATIGL